MRPWHPIHSGKRSAGYAARSTNGSIFSILRKKLKVEAPAVELTITACPRFINQLQSRTQNVLVRTRNDSTKFNLSKNLGDAKANENGFPDE